MVLPFRVESNKDFAVSVPVYRIREEEYQALDYYKIIVVIIYSEEEEHGTELEAD
jgi:hypothetical protein